MTNPAWLRLASAYQRAITLLYRGRLLEFVDNPELADNLAFRRAAKAVARQMVGGVAKVTAPTWRQAAIRMTPMKSIHWALRKELIESDFAFGRLVEQNAELIRRLPREIAEIATERAATEAQRGGRAEEVQSQLRRIVPDVAKWKLRLIARTEVSRATTDITRARSEAIGLNWYQWATSNDTRVRTSHRAMNHVLVAWDDAPAPEGLVGEKSTLGRYHAGACPNCRCEPLVVTSLNEIRWPAKVHRAGRIVTMGRAEFTKLIGISLAA